MQKKKPSESNYSRTASLATPYRPVDPIGHIVYLRTLTAGAMGLFPFFSYPLFFTQMGEIKAGIRFSAKKRRCPHAAYAGHVLDVGPCMTLVLLFCETSGERIRSHMHRA